MNTELFVKPEIPRDVLKNTVKNVISKSMSLRDAAMRFNIRKLTLFDRVVRARKRSNNNMEDSGNEGGESILKICNTASVFTKGRNRAGDVSQEVFKDMLRLDI
ncbi:numb [Holotrichia oblita]|uniref:Numb n=1 Tax=Holotrichia oblita TaxID=644536 RepID=A0ACB9T1I7_HOLOL|nr:numb [Holotrichia oblita]